MCPTGGLTTNTATRGPCAPDMQGHRSLRINFATQLVSRVCCPSRTYPALSHIWFLAASLCFSSTSGFGVACHVSSDTLQWTDLRVLCVYVCVLLWHTYRRHGGIAKEGSLSSIMSWVEGFIVGMACLSCVGRRKGMWGGWACAGHNSVIGSAAQLLACLER